MNYFEEQKQIFKKISQKHSITESEYISAWNYCVETNSGDSEKFGETRLDLMLKIADKVKFKPTSQIFAKKWDASVLLDKYLVEFIKKYEEKILIPISDLTGEIKKQEQQTLIFSCVCNMSSIGLMVALQCYKKADLSLEEYKEDCATITGNILDFLVEINRGSPEQRIECLIAVDNILVEYPEVHQALSKLYGSNENTPISFIDMVSYILKNEPAEQTKYVTEVKKIIDIYNNRNELELTLPEKNQESKSKRIKL
jgi:hypothetical protein